MQMLSRLTSLILKALLQEAEFFINLPIHLR